MLKRLRYVSLILVIVGAGITGVAFYLRPVGNGTSLLRPSDGPYVKRGAAIYASACASCHGVDLGGQANWHERKPDGLLPAPPHDETGHTWHHPDRVLFDLTKFGVEKYGGPGYRSAMPAFDGKLSDDDIAAVLSYIKSTWPAEIQRRQDAINQSAQESE